MRSVIGDSFLKAANATGRRCAFAQASPSPRTKECSPATCHGPCVTNPNERRSRACSSAKAPPTLAGRGRGPAQSSARSPAISRQHPGPPGLPVPQPSLGGRQWPDSSVTAANWPPVPTSPGGQHLTPKDRAALARGGPKLEVQHGPAPSQARWQWMRHSGRTTRTLEYTAHCPDGDRPSGPIKRRAPTYTES